MAPLSFSRGEKRGKEISDLLTDHTSRRHVERAIGCKLQSKQDQKLLETFSWAMKMMQKARSKGEKAWATRQVEKAQAKISGGWLGKLEAKATAARATKAEWERARGEEQLYLQAKKLQSEISDINKSIQEATREAEEATRLLMEKTQANNASHKQHIEQLEQQLQQIKQATNIECEGQEIDTISTAALRTQNPTQPSAQDLHTGRTLAAQVRLHRARQQRDVAIEGLRWGTRAHWQDKVRECFLRAKVNKFAEDQKHLRTALQELQAKYEQSEAEVWQLQSDLGEEIDDKLHWQQEYEKAKDKGKKKKIPPAKAKLKPAPSDEKKDPFVTHGTAAHERAAQTKDVDQPSRIPDGFTTLHWQAQLKALSQKYD